MVRGESPEPSPSPGVAQFANRCGSRSATLAPYRWRRNRYSPTKRAVGRDDEVLRQRRRVGTPPAIVYCHDYTKIAALAPVPHRKRLYLVCHARRAGNLNDLGAV